MVVVSAISVFIGCGGPGTDDGTGGGTGGAGAGSTTGGGTGGAGAGTTGGGTGAGTTTGGGTGGGVTGGGTGGGTVTTFCEVEPILQGKCSSCHGTTPVSGAPQLMTRAQLIASSPAGGTMLDRSILRMETQPISAAMPPNVGGDAADVATFKAWRSAGAGECNPNTGGGAGGGTGGGTGGGVGGGVGGGTTGGGVGGGLGGGTGGGTGGGAAPEICTSNVKWAFGNSLGGAMNPGEACVTCHTQQHKGPIDGFMGTVYPTLHESALCSVTSVPSGLTVEILDMNGAVAKSFSITAFSDGNFHGGTVGLPSPYRARVKVGGVVKSEMIGPQTNGDCNSCHTSQGKNGAPGRLHW
ncbi:MAG: hypothetical protein U0228_21645 [Myxococcaceae bacterium]